jgi:hypothetical protein
MSSKLPDFASRQQQQPDEAKRLKRNFLKCAFDSRAGRVVPKVFGPKIFICANLQMVPPQPTSGRGSSERRRGRLDPNVHRDISADLYGSGL